LIFRRARVYKNKNHLEKSLKSKTLSFEVGSFQSSTNFYYKKISLENFQIFKKFLRKLLEAKIVQIDSQEIFGGRFQSHQRDSKGKPFDFFFQRFLIFLLPEH